MNQAKIVGAVGATFVAVAGTLHVHARMTPRQYQADAGAIMRQSPYADQRELARSMLKQHPAVSRDDKIAASMLLASGAAVGAAMLRNSMPLSLGAGLLVTASLVQGAFAEGGHQQSDWTMSDALYPDRPSRQSLGAFARDVASDLVAVDKHLDVRDRDREALARAVRAAGGLPPGAAITRSAIEAYAQRFDLDGTGDFDYYEQTRYLMEFRRSS